VIFNTDQEQYVGDLTEGAGIRVVVHNQTDMPFPEDQSVAVSPGTLTYIGASLVSVAPSTEIAIDASRYFEISTKIHNQMPNCHIYECRQCTLPILFLFRLNLE